MKKINLVESDSKSLESKTWSWEDVKVMEPKMAFKLGQWVTIICKAHKDLTNKLAIVVSYTPDKFYQVIYKEESILYYFKNGVAPFFDGYFGYSQLVSVEKVDEVKYKELIEETIKKQQEILNLKNLDPDCLNQTINL